MGVLAVAIALAVVCASSFRFGTLTTGALVGGAVALDLETRALAMSVTVSKLQCDQFMLPSQLQSFR